MSSSLHKVKSGDPLAIPAATYNAFIDAAVDHRSRRQNISATDRPTVPRSGLVLVRNDSGQARDRFDVLGVDTPVITPAANAAEFSNRVALSCITPQPQHIGRFVVLTEPLAAGQMGLACASGVVQVRLDVLHEDIDCADVAEGDATCLATSANGSATVLWRESGGSGTVWAVVKLSATPQGTHDNPKTLGGSGATADTEAWDIDDQPEGHDGVEFKPFRLYWSGNSGEPVYQFIRTPTYDSLGRLVAVSAEVRTVAFETGPCES